MDYEDSNRAREARELVDELSDMYEPEFDRVTREGAYVTVLLPREIPTGFLEVVGGRADLRVEAIAGSGDVEALLIV